MAEIPSDPITTQSHRRKELWGDPAMGRVHRRIPFVIQNVNNADTYASGVLFPTHVAWEPLDSAHYVAPDAAPDGTITFFTSGTNRHGYLHIWSDVDWED